MDIYILRDGKQLGPFSRDAAQILIRQGTISAGDLAWHAGTTDWLPLGEVLDAAPSSEPSATTSESISEQPPPTPASTEPATAAQIAFLSYFGIAISAGLSKEAAEGLIAGASADPRNAKRVQSWEVDRLRLHRDLFNAQLRDPKEDRVQLFYDLCQTAGADHFTGVTKAHCQVLVAFLDVSFPRWDADRAGATERYFFPAVAEKFPQLVTRAWRGRLQDNEKAAIIARATRKLPTTKLEPRTGSLWVAILRGIVLGLVILVVLYFAHAWLQTRKPSAPAAEKTAAAGAVRFLG